MNWGETLQPQIGGGLSCTHSVRHLLWHGQFWSCQGLRGSRFLEGRQTANVSSGTMWWDLGVLLGMCRNQPCWLPHSTTACWQDIAEGVTWSYRGSILQRGTERLQVWWSSSHPVNKHITNWGSDSGHGSGLLSCDCYMPFPHLGPYFVSGTEGRRLQGWRQ